MCILYILCIYENTNAHKSLICIVHKLFIKMLCACMCWWCTNAQTHLYLYVLYLCNIYLLCLYFYFSSYMLFKCVKCAYVWSLFVCGQMILDSGLNTIYEAPTPIAIYTIYGTHKLNKCYIPVHTHTEAYRATAQNRMMIICSLICSIHSPSAFTNVCVIIEIKSQEHQ